MNAIFNFVNNLIQNPVQTVVRAVTQFVSNPVGTIIGVAKDIFAPQGGGSGGSSGSNQNSAGSGSSNRSSGGRDDADRRGADEARRQEAQRRAEEARLQELAARFDKDADELNGHILTKSNPAYFYPQLRSVEDLKVSKSDLYIAAKASSLSWDVFLAAIHEGKPKSLTNEQWLGTFSRWGKDEEEDNSALTTIGLLEILSSSSRLLQSSIFNSPFPINQEGLEALNSIIDDLPPSDRNRIINMRFLINQLQHGGNIDIVLGVELGGSTRVRTVEYIESQREVALDLLSRILYPRLSERERQYKSSEFSEFSTLEILANIEIWNVVIGGQPTSWNGTRISQVVAMSFPDLDDFLMPLPERIISNANSNFRTRERLLNNFYNNVLIRADQRYLTEQFVGNRQLEWLITLANDDDTDVSLGDIGTILAAGGIVALIPGQFDDAIWAQKAAEIGSGFITWGSRLGRIQAALDLVEDPSQWHQSVFTFLSSYLPSTRPLDLGNLITLSQTPNAVSNIANYAIDLSQSDLNTLAVLTGYLNYEAPEFLPRAQIDILQELGYTSIIPNRVDLGQRLAEFNTAIFHLDERLESLRRIEGGGVSKGFFQFNETELATYRSLTDQRMILQQIKDGYIRMCNAYYPDAPCS